MLLILKVAMLSWPRFETDTKRPDGCKFIPPQVDLTVLSFSGSDDIVCI